MIDWFRGEVEFLHDPLPSGRMISLDVDGSIEWECVKSLQVRSSHETSLKIRSAGGNGEGRATALMIDGNLAKFLQGHNVFGSCDLNKLLLLSFRKVYQQLNEHLHGCSPDITEAKIRRGDYLVKMIDINNLYDCVNDPSVEAWLHAAEMRARSRHGRSGRDKGTVYLGKSSKRWAFKFYNKWREITSHGKTHKLPFELRGIGLEDFAKGKLRAELRLFGKELSERHGITHGRHITSSTITELFNYYLEKIDMTTQATLLDDELFKLPRTVQATYQLWRQGADVRHLLSEPTFYRHRHVLKQHGVDIACPHLHPNHNNVVPLIRVIEAVPVAIPQWAYERNLIAA